MGVEDVRDTWDGVGNTAVVTDATPNGFLIGGCGYSPLAIKTKLAYM